MYTIVDIQGKQYKVTKGAVINVDRLDKDVGAQGPAPIIKLDKVLLCSNGTETLIGQPYLKNVKVEAQVLGEVKGKKVIAFKYKRRKGYHRKVGHRQKFTILKIINIEAPISERKAEKKEIEVGAHGRVPLHKKPAVAKAKSKKRAVKK